ncbi:MAG: murein L,D-transpeptidase [Steroidobacteraceae bacterium]
MRQRAPIRPLEGAPFHILSRGAAVVMLLMLVAAGRAAETPAGGTPALRWFDSAGLTPPARALLDAMGSAREWGLDPRDYDAAQILSDSRALDASRHRVKIDAALSAAALRFVSHLHSGRIDPRSVGFDMPARGREFDPEAVLARLAATGDTRAVLASVEPPFRHYALLKAQLGRYRALAAQPGRTPLPPIGAHSIAAGESYAGAPALRSWLVVLGDLPVAQRANDADHSLDPHLVEALRRFQFRHGLAQDGVLGRRTYAALTVPLDFRVRQIGLTLERWRWLPVLNAPTIIVNIPQFRLFAFGSAGDQESRMLTMDVIVGQTYPRTRTPVFSADLKYVEFRPYWDVPYSIMSREQLPRIRSRPDYLVAQDLEIVGQDGTVTQHPDARQIADLAAGAARLRQRPGPRNALGLVKFAMPNAYNVLLHDTPANELFRTARRAFSHGCIRVSDPAALAQFVLRQAGGEWPREKIVAAMQGPATVRVDLKQWVRVLIVYGTAVATEQGSIYFFDDIYGNDARLTRLLGLQ